MNLLIIAGTVHVCIALVGVLKIADDTDDTGSLNGFWLRRRLHLITIENTKTNFYVLKLSENITLSTVRQISQLELLSMFPKKELEERLSTQGLDGYKTKSNKSTWVSEFAWEIL